MSATEQRPYRTEQWLRRKYEGEGLTIEGVAAEAGVTHTTIIDWMDRHGIEREVGRHGTADEARLLHDLVGVARELGRRPSCQEYNRRAEHSASCIPYRWGDGTWSGAMDELLGPLGY
jgi:hypothetical protein